MSALRRLRAVGPLLAYYGWNFLRANALVAWEVIRPRSRPAPGIVRVRVHADRPWQVALFANLVSLTPGTLTLDVADDLRAIYVHGLHVHSTDEFREQLTELETRLLEVIG